MILNVLRSFKLESRDHISVLSVGTLDNLLNDSPWDIVEIRSERLVIHILNERTHRINRQQSNLTSDMKWQSILIHTVRSIFCPLLVKYQER